MASSAESSVWGDSTETTSHNERQNKKEHGPEKHRGHGQSCCQIHGTKSGTIDVINYFHRKIEEVAGVVHLQRMPSPTGKTNWDLIFSKASYVDAVIEDTLKFPL